MFSGTALKDYLEANVMIVAEGPAWGDESVPAMAEMIGHLEQYTPDQVPDQYFAFGYVAARAVTQVLEAAVVRGDLSREGIVEAMNGLANIDLAGLLGDYQWGPPEDRDPPRSNTFFRVRDGQPVGLELVEADYSSEAARAYEFDH